MTTVLPVALAFIMFCVGTSLSSRDFLRVFHYPGQIGMGLALQLLGLPLLALSITTLVPMPETVAIGLWLLALAPGGATSNAITQLCGGNSALSITLTAISSLIIPISIPLLLPFGMPGTQLDMPFLSTVMQLVIVTLLPVILGMMVRKRVGNDKINSVQPLLQRVAFMTLLATVVIIVLANLKVLEQLISIASAAALLLCLSGMLLGFLVGQLWPSQSKLPITYCIEVGIQNAGTAIFVAAVLLQKPELALTPLLYGILMNIPVVALIIFQQKRRALVSH